MAQEKINNWIEQNSVFRDRQGNKHMKRYTHSLVMNDVQIIILYLLNRQ